MHSQICLFQNIFWVNIPPEIHTVAPNLVFWVFCAILTSNVFKTSLHLKMCLIEYQYDSRYITFWHSIFFTINNKWLNSTSVKRSSLFCWWQVAPIVVVGVQGCRTLLWRRVQSRGIDFPALILVVAVTCRCGWRWPTASRGHGTLSDDLEVKTKHKLNYGNTLNAQCCFSVHIKIYLHLRSFLQIVMAWVIANFLHEWRWSFYPA